ncbi:AraC family transcriptional regulator [Micromonospora qiuiae]|uniref:AraC family transcriptional regulator n=1 Tax=Micromonospora qiuiae TaxID=502268 RepID=A0ABQ4JGP7_9ACTN|nr:helix-turn-helix domain-containing protein [Micromonospora qiuiae]GIJ29601.1 AraC family transcriptional regulator [Micromonospora qiuiae]
MDIYAEFRTDGLPQTERFAVWQEAVDGLLPSVVRTDRAAEFQASARTVSLGDIQVSALAFSPLNAHRSPTLIRRHDPGQAVMWLSLSNGLRFDLVDGPLLIDEGKMLLYTSSQPFRFLGRNPVRGLLMQLPVELLPMPKTATPLIGAALPSQEGIGALLTRYLVELVQHADRYRPTDVPRLSTITVDLVTAFLHSRHPDGTPPSPDTHRRVLRLRIHDFLERRLGDPNLSPQAVAAAHGISVRTLYRLFEKESLTMADWIRHRRLERCRNDLADPLLAHRTIQMVASRWGFTDAAHFSRIFRSAYGISPKDYRAERKPISRRP